MQMTARKWYTRRSEVVLLELLVLPAAIPKHFSRQLSFQFDSFNHILRSFGDSERLDSFDIQMFALFVFF